MSSVNEEVTAPFESEKIKEIERQEKIEEIDPDFMLLYRVRLYGIGSNQHVNDAMYLNWIVDVLEHDFLTTHASEKVTARFDKEVEYGNEIESHFEQILTEDGVKTKHEIRMQEQPYCEANTIRKNK